MTASLLSQLSKLRKEKELIEKKERALLSKTNSQAIAQIKAIMKDSGLSLETLVASLESKRVALKNSATPSAKKTVLKSKAQQKSSKPAKPRVSLAGIKVPIKFKHPSQPHLTWTGRGKTPAWVSELKKSGQIEAAKVV
jgi:DNA-binding protein H-NS